MSLSCNVVQDLIVLFHEDVVSEETRRDIRVHLKGCRECRKLYKEYTHLNQEEFQPEEEPRPEHELSYSRLAERLRKRKLWRHSVVVAAFALCIAITVAVTKAILKGEE